MWSDDRDGTGSISTATLGAVNTNIPGVYSLTYVYTDQAGNRGIAVRSVVVQSKYSTTVLVGPGGG